MWGRAESDPVLFEGFILAVFSLKGSLVSEGGGGEVGQQIIPLLVNKSLIRV